MDSARPDFASSWHDLEHRSPRSVARGAALSLLAGMERVGGKLASSSAVPRVQVLIMHHLFPDEEDGFRRLLAMLAKQHTFISYSEAVERAAEAGSRIAAGKPAIAFTFDDGFKNCLRAAAILEEFNARACFFVCPTIIGEPDRGKVASFCRDRLELPRPVEFMDCDDLARLQEAGHEIGGHTMTHPHLNRIPIDRARDEIVGCLEFLRGKFGEVRHFAWTYGRFADFNADLANLVYRAGFASCASGERGCHGPQRTGSGTPPCIRRDHIVAGWPLGHSLHFLARSAVAVSPESGEWPAGWAVGQGSGPV